VCAKHADEACVRNVGTLTDVLTGGKEGEEGLVEVVDVEREGVGNRCAP
jgi:hypothetical protein